MEQFWPLLHSVFRLVYYSGPLSSDRNAVPLFEVRVVLQGTPVAGALGWIPAVAGRCSGMLCAGTLII